MYYLRLEPFLKETPLKSYMTDDRAIYKHTKFSRYYRQSFRGFNNRTEDYLRLYTCKTLKTILDLRKSLFGYCGEWFDVYDENGKIEIK